VERARSSGASIDVDSSDGGLTFRASSETLFIGDGAETTRRGDAFLAAVLGAAGTFPELHAAVVHERRRGETEADPASVRRAVVLGAAIFRRAGLPLRHLVLQSRSAVVDGFSIRIQPGPFPPDPSASTLSGALVDASPPDFDGASPTPLRFDVLFLDPARVRRWSLKLLRGDPGVLVRSYEGTTDVGAALDWNGLDARDRPSPPGRYRAVLAATTFDGRTLLDTVEFRVIRPVGRSAAPPVRIPTDPPSARVWSQTLRFPPGRSDAAGLSVLELRQLADNILGQPGVTVVLQGSADVRGRSHRALAEERARTVLTMLTERYGVPSERLSVRVRDPRAVSGDDPDRVDAFFVDGEAP
jgi:hypothetical protein